MKKSLTLAVGIALTALSSVSYADNDSSLIIKDEANSAHANFFIERNEMSFDLMAEFGYFRSSTKGDLGQLAMPYPNDMNMSEPMPGPAMPFMPGNSEHAYLVLHIVALTPPPFPFPEPIPGPMPEPLPEPTLDPMLDPIPGPDAPLMQEPTEENVDSPMMDPNMPHPPTDPTLPPPHAPFYEVLYFELSSGQFTVSDESTTVTVDGCQQPSMHMNECGPITVTWKNNDMNSREDKIKSLSKSKNGFLGQSITTKGKTTLKYSTATATINAMGHMLDNEYGGQTSSKSTQKISFGINNE